MDILEETDDSTVPPLCNNVHINHMNDAHENYEIYFKYYEKKLSANSDEIK